MKNNKKNAARLTARVMTLVLALVMIAGGIIVRAEETLPEGEAAEKTELEQFIADWGESYAGGMGTKDYTLDFDSYELGTDFSTLEDLMENWVMQNATGDHITKIDGTEENKYLSFAPFAQMYLAEGLTDKYVFSADLKLPANHGFGMFIRTTGETNVNPYFEDDQSGLGIFGIGPNGIFVIPSGKSLKIFVKYYDEKKSVDKGMKYLNNKLVTLKTEQDFSAGLYRISIADYGTGAKIFVEGQLIATLEFSEIVDGYDEMLSEYKFYSNVKVIDNTGKQKAEVKNALVCAETSVLAFGMRINEAIVDNVVISEYQEAITDVSISGTPKTNYTVGDKFDAAGAVIVTTYESGKTKKTAITESMLEGFDTSSAGEKTAKIVFGDKEFELVITVAEPAAPTEAPAPTEAAATGDKAATPKPDDEKTDNKKDNKPLIIGLVVGGILIVAIAVVAILLKAKSGKGKK